MNLWALRKKGTKRRLLLSSRDGLPILSDSSWGKQEYLSERPEDGGRPGKPAVYLNVRLEVIE